jgi:hypothetical protein
VQSPDEGFFLSRQQPPSQWRHSWVYGTAKYRVYRGKTIGTGNCMFLAQSGEIVMYIVRSWLWEHEARLKAAVVSKDKPFGSAERFP